MRKIIFITLMCAFMSVPALADLYVNVPGTSTVYFAGQTSIISSDFDEGNDGTSNIPPSVDITGFIGGPIHISATGSWGYAGSGTQEGPDGGILGGSGISQEDYDDLGISLLTAPYNGLAGVFLTNAAPNPGATPIELTSQTTTPVLQQAFYIGSSLDNITIPLGATRLFFGLHNYHNWYNNSGSVDVTVVPVPGAILLGLLGLSVVGVKLRKFA